MQTKNPNWWTQEHTSAWARVRDAMKRDWEQTKYDLTIGGKDLNQSATETVEQGAFKAPLPPPNVPNQEPDAETRWSALEGPLTYGYGARLTYGQAHASWNDALEADLKRDWHERESERPNTWENVKDVVRRGYEYVAAKT